MRFLYYDRIIRIQKGRDISGIKSFSLSEEFLRGHYRNVAIVPGTIMIEAMAQILGWLVIYSHDFTLSAIMTLIEDVTVTADLRPGFSAEISGELISTSKRDSLGRVKMFADPDHATFTNLTISNVPGPRQQFYFEGAEVEGMYPVSVLAGDQRLNISVLSYRERLHFGLVACPDTLPSVQYLALQLPVALRELEAEMRSAGTGRRRRQPATTAAARPAPRRTAPVAR